MLTQPVILAHVMAAPFRTYMASGRTFDVRPPEMVDVGKNDPIHFYFEEWESVSLMLTESISHIEAPVA